MSWRAIEDEVGSFSTIFTEKLTSDFTAAQADARSHGYRLVGQHARTHAYLLKGANDYRILSERNRDAGPEALGIAVDDPEAALEFGWSDDRFEVFSAGAVGPLRMHLPGLRYKPDGQFVYLIAKGGEGHFFAVDFEPVKEL